MGMLRELVKVMTGIVITLNDNRSIRRKTDVPADKTYLWNDTARTLTDENGNKAAYTVFSKPME